jgi:hypothetical protein
MTNNIFVTTRKGGKSNIADILSDWLESSPKEAEEIQWAEFNIPPLAIVLAMLESGKQPYEVGHLLTYGTDTVVVSEEHKKQASEIYSYFAKKHTLRRVKGEWISEYMTALDNLCENQLKINKAHIGILVSLPRIYTQNRNLELVMKGHVSYDNSKVRSWMRPLDETVEFVKSVNVTARGQGNVQYYWKTDANRLVRIVVPNGDYGKLAWDSLSQHGKIRITSDISHLSTIKGYDFTVVQPTTNAKVELV